MKDAVKTRNLNIRTTDQEYDAIRAYAAFNNKSMSDTVLDTLREAIEDWEDIEAYEAYLADGDQGLVTWDEVKAGLDRANGL